MSTVQTQIQCDAKNCEYKASRKITYKPVNGEPREVRTICGACFEKEDSKGIRYYQHNIESEEML